MRVAALDLGSNSFLCLIADVVDGQFKEILYDDIRFVRLGQGVAQTKMFDEGALVRAEDALADFATSIDRWKPERVLAMATSAARDVKNSDRLLAMAEKFHMPLQIISGSDEARLTYLGAISGAQGPGPNLVIDVGGGSTEYIYGENQSVSFARSLNLGSVRHREMFVKHDPPRADELDRLRQDVQKSLMQLQLDRGAARVIGVAGTPTELARIEVGEFDPAKLDGYILTRSGLEDWIAKFAVRTSLAIQQDFDVQAGRSDVLIVGTIVLSESLRYFKAEEFTVSTRGVRYGIALDLAFHS